MLKTLSISAILISLFFATAAFAVRGQLGDPVYGPDHRHYFAQDATHSFKAAISGKTEATQICIFCHTPHGASNADGSKLWNRGAPDTTSFPLYGQKPQGEPGSAAIRYNSTAKIAAQYYNTAGLYPNGDSRLCMSCHDGITAIGDVLNDAGGTLGIPMASGADTIVDVRGAGYNTVIDLATSHPISFVYDASVVTAINDYEDLTFFNYMQSPDESITPLDGRARMQCTTCHDPHFDTRLGNATYLPMWRYHPNGGDPGSIDYTDVCASCHADGGDIWPGSHEIP